MNEFIRSRYLPIVLNCILVSVRVRKDRFLSCLKSTVELAEPCALAVGLTGVLIVRTSFSDNNTVLLPKLSVSVEC